MRMLGNPPTSNLKPNLSKEIRVSGLDTCDALWKGMEEGLVAGKGGLK